MLLMDYILVMRTSVLLVIFNYVYLDAFYINRKSFPEIWMTLSRSGRAESMTPQNFKNFDPNSFLTRPDSKYSPSFYESLNNLGFDPNSVPFQRYNPMTEKRPTPFPSIFQPQQHQPSSSNRILNSQSDNYVKPTTSGGDILSVKQQIPKIQIFLPSNEKLPDFKPDNNIKTDFKPSTANLDQNSNLVFNPNKQQSYFAEFNPNSFTLNGRKWPATSITQAPASQNWNGKWPDREKQEWNGQWTKSEHNGYNAGEEKTAEELKASKASGKSGYGDTDITTPSTPSKSWDGSWPGEVKGFSEKATDSWNAAVGGKKWKESVGGFVQKSSTWNSALQKSEGKKTQGEGDFEQTDEIIKSLLRALQNMDT